MSLDDEGADAATDLLDGLFTTKQRIRIFECIARSDGIRNKDIAEKADCAKGTVSEFTGVLRERDLVKKDDQEFQLTPIGKCVSPSVLELAYRGAIVGEYLSPFFSQLTTTGDTGIETVVDDLVTADVMEVSGGIGVTAKEEYRKLINSYNHVKELATVRTFPGNSYPERLNGGLEGEFVLKQNLADRLQNEDPDFLESLIEAEGTEYVKAVETDFDFTISVFKKAPDASYGTVALIQLEKFVIVTTKDTNVLRWAEDCFERYADRGTTMDDV